MAKKLRDQIKIYKVPNQEVKGAREGSDHCDQECSEKGALKRQIFG